MTPPCHYLLRNVNNVNFALKGESPFFKKKLFHVKQCIFTVQSVDFVSRETDLFNTLGHQQVDEAVEIVFPVKRYLDRAASLAAIYFYLGSKVALQAALQLF